MTSGQRKGREGMRGRRAEKRRLFVKGKQGESEGERERVRVREQEVRVGREGREGRE